MGKGVLAVFANPKSRNETKIEIVSFERQTIELWW